jgi:hypothetical protein
MGLKAYISRPRQIEVPQGVREAPGHIPDALVFLKQLAYSHQREYMCWIEGARSDQIK